jgi:hypothetical protein
VYPMLFKLSNTTVERHTHCGVLEFVADEGRCYLPYWVRGIDIDILYILVSCVLRCRRAILTRWLSKVDSNDLMMCPFL